MRLRRLVAFGAGVGAFVGFATELVRRKPIATESGYVPNVEGKVSGPGPVPIQLPPPDSVASPTLKPPEIR